MATVAEFYEYLDPDLMQFLRANGDSAMQTPQVPVIVGRCGREKNFAIPWDILSGWIPQELLNDHISKSDLEPVSLPDESSTAFTYYHHYTYNRDVPFLEPPKIDPAEPETKTKRTQYIHELCETRVFGDKYDVHGLQNCAVYKLCEVLRERLHTACAGEDDMNVETMKYCYSYTEPESKLRNLVADHVVRIEREFFAEEERLLEEDLLIEKRSRDLPKPDLRCHLFEYQNFARDVQKADKIYNSYSETFGSCPGPNYLKPQKYSERFEVDVDDNGKIPITSRAVWRISRLRNRCEHCGVDRAENYSHHPDSGIALYCTQLCKPCSKDMES